MDGTSVTNSVIIACCVVDDDDTSLFCFCCGILLLCILVDNDEGGANANVFDVANMDASTIVRDRMIISNDIKDARVANYNVRISGDGILEGIFTLDSVLHS